jgi:hypothetical protein
MDKRPILLWAVAHWDKGLYADTVRRTRKEAIDAFVSQFVPKNQTWKTESQYGVHRAVRVTTKIWEGHEQ